MKKHVKILLIKIALVSVISVSVSTSLVGCKSKELKEFEKLIENRDYIAAATYYWSYEEALNKDKEDVEAILQKACDDIYNTYVSNELSYEQTIYNLNSLQSLSGLSDIYISDKINLVNSNNSFSSAEQFMQNKEYSNAISNYKKVIETDEHYDTAQQKIKECEKLYIEELFVKAEEYIQKNDYRAAINYLKNYVDTFSDAKEINEKISEYTDKIVEQDLDDTYKLIEKGNYYEAIQSIEKLEEKYKDSKKLTEVKKEAQKSYTDTVLPIIKECVKNKDYTNAYSLCVNVLAVDPNNEEVKKIKDQVEPLKPVLLNEMKISESSAFEHLEDLSKTYEDVVGNTYQPGNLYRMTLHHDGWGSNTDGYAKIYLNAQYTKLTGTLATDDSSEAGEFVIKIVGDDKVIYNETFSRSTPPKKLNIDVKGKKWIEFLIAYPNSDDDLRYTSNALFSNIGFSK